MPRKKDNSSESLSCAVIYGEDLEEIITKIKCVCENVVLVTNNTEFESIEEIRQHVGNKLKELNIEGSNSSPYKSLSVNFSSYSVSLYRSANDAEAKAVWYDLRDLIKKRRRKFSYVFNTEFWAFSVLVVSAVLIVFANFQYRVPLWLWAVDVTVFVFFTVSMWSPSSGSVIHLNRRYTVSNFWERNKDELIKLIIAAIVGATLTLLLQFLTKLGS